MFSGSIRHAGQEAVDMRAAARRALAAFLCLTGVACTGLDGVGPQGDPCAATTPIGLGQAASGALSSDDCLRPDGRYVDRWALSISTAMTVRIDLSSNQFDVVLELYDAQDRLLAWNDDAAGSTNSRLSYPLGPGTYVVTATSYGERATGSYQLTVGEGADCTPVGSIAVGETVSGTLTPDDCLFEYGTVSDNWTLSVSSPQAVRVIMDSDDFEEGVVIRDPNGSIFYGAATPGPGEPATFDVDLQAGSYTLVASMVNEGGSGSYELTVQQPPPCSPGDPLELDAEVFGELTGEDCTLQYWGTADTWSLELSEETAVMGVLKSLDFPPVIVVRDEQGMEIAVGHDYTGTGTATFEATLDAGTYAVMPTTYYSGARGEYHLTVSEAVCPEPESIALGETLSGELTATDCRRSGDQYRDLWTIEVDTTSAIRFDLVSTAFDAYLVLEDELGNEIEVDDDSGVGSNARIDRTLDPGTYVLVASSWGAYQTGRYELTAVGHSPAAAAVGSRGSDPQAKAEQRSSARMAAPGAPARYPELWWVIDPRKARF